MTEWRCHCETLEEAYGSRASYGAPSWPLDAWMSTYRAIAADEVATVTDDIDRLTGHHAASLTDLRRQNRSAI